jgi:hypothetical protein
MPTTENERHGIRCPKCACADTHVVRTMKIEGTWRGFHYHKIRRYRVCRYCGHSFATVEDYSDNAFDKVSEVALPRTTESSPGEALPPNPFL